MEKDYEGHVGVGSDVRMAMVGVRGNTRSYIRNARVHTIG